MAEEAVVVAKFDYVAQQEQELDIKKNERDFPGLPGASLVAQWLRVCLPMQGTRVRALDQEDPTCHGAAGPVSHNY
ncbi:hypothetical protein J1605_000181 [Eschrichtius robustus]|uniref:Uncharacterized protein n=1 Tax=Eschrichtius robustus TaxID=9764 RepID=A0AB34HND7_ESCRO|nr:hypothetical protein J1605_000181 [Eschrichtius robustus]